MCREDFLAGLEVSFCRASEKEQSVGIWGWCFWGGGEKLPHLSPCNPTV